MQSIWQRNLGLNQDKSGQSRLHYRCAIPLRWRHETIPPTPSSFPLSIFPISRVAYRYALLAPDHIIVIVDVVFVALLSASWTDIRLRYDTVWISSFHHVLYDWVIWNISVKRIPHLRTHPSHSAEPTMRGSLYVLSWCMCRTYT